MKPTHPISIYVNYAFTVLKYHAPQGVPVTRMVKLNIMQSRWFRSRKSRKRKQALRVVVRQYINAAQAA